MQSTPATVGAARGNDTERLGLPMLSNDTVRIPLRTYTGAIRAYALVDAADADWVNRWRWYLNPNGYAIRVGYINGRKCVFRLHRELLGLKPGDGTEGDHIDRDKLNNRRLNLRVTTHTGNGQNVSPRQGVTSKHRGVAWHRGAAKWEAYVQLNGHKVYLGLFADEMEAANTARASRLEHMAGATD